MDAHHALEQVDKHLNNADWLVGAGISFDANIPLMVPLTERVASQLLKKTPRRYKLYKSIRNNLPNYAHIEHVLSHIVDLISLVERSEKKSVTFNKCLFTEPLLNELYVDLVEYLTNAIQFGYCPKMGDVAERVGNRDKPIVEIRQHREFVRALFTARNAGRNQSRGTIRFFTTNYDTLLEDAMAFESVYCIDGFQGGAVAFWAPDLFEKSANSVSAFVFKLHGSTDWFLNKSGEFLKCRDPAYQIGDYSRVLIYPQQTKYLVTQKNPFSLMLSQFRSALNSSSEVVIAVCGYSFGDEHINAEIKVALERPKNRITLICFVKEQDMGDGKGYRLPPTVDSWLLRDADGQIFVLSDKGLYWGNKGNLFPTEKSDHNWWTFSGVIDVLSNGFTGKSSDAAI